MRRLAATLAAAVLGASVAACGIPGTDRPHRAVGPDAAVMREAFNADVGKVRVVALLSPTCGVCLRGATELQERVFGKIADDRLRGYAVWVPKLDAREKDVPEATHTIADPRVEHYWDDDWVLVFAYDKTLDLRSDAWDMFLVYGPQVRWDGPEPPRPTYWMHQLGSKSKPTVNGPFFDAEVFADHVRELL